MLFAGYKITESEVSCDSCFPNDHPILSNHFKFVTTGFFAGLAKTFTLAPQHYTNLAFAAGMMNGEYDPEAGPGGSNTSLGCSVTASYIYKINEKWMLSTGVKSQAYDYNDLAAASDSTVDSANEEFTTLFFKASYTL